MIAASRHRSVFPDCPLAGARLNLWAAVRHLAEAQNAWGSHGPRADREILAYQRAIAALQSAESALAALDQPPVDWSRPTDTNRMRASHGRAAMRAGGRRYPARQQRLFPEPPAAVPSCDLAPPF
jgi:hypothetical protein